VRYVKGMETAPRHDQLIDGACPTCAGQLATRFTRSMVWAWCGTCLRLTRPVLIEGAGGPVLLHRSAAA
jgi:hypothetical protein